MEDVRQIWYWDGAASISQLAKYGTTAPKNCKFAVRVDTVLILDAIEIIPCTEKAVRSIEAVKDMDVIKILDTNHARRKWEEPEGSD